jgi:hypothetical protein
MLLKDFSFAARTLVKSPVFTVAAAFPGDVCSDGCRVLRHRRRVIVAPGAPRRGTGSYRCVTRRMNVQVASSEAPA